MASGKQVAFIAPLPLEGGTWWGRRRLQRSFPELLGLLPRWTPTVRCVKAGRGCWPHLTEVCTIHGPPFVQMGRQRLLDGQRLATWAAYWVNGKQGG